MNAFSLSGILAGTTALIFGLFVFLKCPDKKLGRIWFIFNLLIVVWGFGGCLYALASDPLIVMSIIKIAYSFGVIWISTLFFHFICQLTGHKSPKFLILNYVISAIFTVLVQTKYFFTHVEFMFGEFYYGIGGIIFKIFFVWWSAVVVYSHVIVYSLYKKELGQKKTQYKYLFLSTAIGYGGGAMCYLPNFGIMIYPWGNFFISVYPILMSYAILRFNLMDIRIFFRRVGLLIFIYGVLMLLAMPFLFGFQEKVFSLKVLGSGMLIAKFIFLSALFSVGPFLYAYFIQQSSYFNEHTMAGLTHELKSPLALIQGAVDALGSRIRKSGDSVQIDYLDMIERNNERLTQSVEQLLQVYKLQGKAHKVQFSKASLNKIVDEAIESYKPQAKKKNILLESNISDPIEIHCDAVRIKQVLSNLISNALKFTNEGKIEVTAKLLDSQVEVSVKDSGAGIPKEDLPFIFDRFFQGKYQPHLRGTGIGLTIAQTWIDAHRGKIWAESEGMGKGSVIRFTVPL